MPKQTLLLNANEEILLEGQPQSRFMIYLSLTHFLSIVVKIVMLLFVIYAFLLFTHPDTLRLLLSNFANSTSTQELASIPNSQQLSNIFYVFGLFQAIAVQHLTTLAIIVTIIFVLSIAYSKKLLSNTQYFLTNQRIVFCSGVLLQRKQTIFHSTVSDITSSSNVLQTLLKINNLSIASVAATTKPLRRSKQQSSTIIINGLSTQQVEQITNLVTRYKQETMTNHSLL